MRFKKRLDSIDRQIWVIICMAAIAAAVFCVLILFGLQSCDRFDPLAETKQLIEQHTERSLKADRAKAAELANQVNAIQGELDILRDEIRESVEKRERLHDAIINADNIDDIDAILHGRAP